MKSLCARLLFGCGLVATLASIFLAWSERSLAQDASRRSSAQQESIKIEPYKGPPVFLEEREKVNVEAKIVNREILKEKLGDGRIEREVARFSDDSFAADGIYREFHPNDKPFIEGQFVKGRQEGEWKYYFDNGQLNRKATYKGGKPNGSWEVYRADGTIQAMRGFKDGFRDGEWITYDATGKQQLSEEHYVRGEPDGVWKTWYPNGQQKLQVTFKKGKREGASIEWDEKGQKRLEAEYSDNKLNGTATRWFPDGRKIVQKYDNNRLVSESKE